jgi:tetratricopeptide (TPR) repeat protein
MDNKKKNQIIGIVVIIVVVAVLAFFKMNKKEAVVDAKNDEVANVEEKPADIKPAIELDTKEKEIGLLFDQAVKEQIKGDFKASKLTLEKALAIDPQNAYIMQTYASLLNNMGDKAGAMTWINKALAIQPKETNFWYLKFDLAKEASKNDAKVMDPIYLEAITKTNNDIDMVTAYASFLGTIGKKSEAIKQWQKAIELNPSRKEMYQAEIDALK